MSASLLDAGDMRRTLGRMAHEVLESNRGAEDLVVVGVLKRGFPVAKRLAFAMTQIEGVTVPCGSLDVRAFRDDSSEREATEDESEIPFAVTGKKVVLVDEVIQTGRTVRAAMDALMHHGRPAQIQLAIMLDRGGRELPIQPEYVGAAIEVEPEEYIEVRFAEVDGEDAVLVTKGAAPCTS
ncbi:MAG: bifunctional pyr operon transcriptional regulator/uracil phosphoribosyltransferase PyrR [Armatimonadetes bacterium]|nr:bifunctional pyr operon transcriptional regulator/uracil phosphoribosyltransferase PyrR [Armatimonadota bacterium]